MTNAIETTYAALMDAVRTGGDVAAAKAAWVAASEDYMDTQKETETMTITTTKYKASGWLVTIDGIGYPTIHPSKRRAIARAIYKHTGA